METQTSELRKEAAPAGELDRLREMVETGRVPDARHLVEDLGMRWPLDPHVRNWTEILNPPRARRTGEATGRRLDAERAWFREHGRDYPDCWLAVRGSQLVAVGHRLEEVMAEIAKTPDLPPPLIRKQPPKQT